MQANWIAQTWRPASSGHVFRPPAANGGELEHPRSAAADASAALEALVAHETAWRARTEQERRGLLVRVAECIAREPDPGAAFERAEDELVGSVREGPRAVLGAAFGSRPGIVVVRCDWSELVTGVAREVLAALALGRGVLLLSDPGAPMVAEAVASAFAVIRAPAPLALLHEDGSAVLQHVLRDPRVRGLVVSAPSARMRELERWLNDAHRSAAATSAFGAGLDEQPVPERSLRVLRNHSRIVGRACDLETEAREVVAAAFGRARALSGQAPGAVGRVLCHERALSRFTASLLAELARSPDVARPLATLDPALHLHHRRAVELGLDEGATPIFTSADQSSEAPPEAHRLAPVVFTNVEEHLRLAWLGRPAPLLCLLRFDDDARAEELASALDRDPLAEDLSGETHGAMDGPAVEFAAQAAGWPGPMRGSSDPREDEDEETEQEP